MLFTKKTIVKMSPNGKAIHKRRKQLGLRLYNLSDKTGISNSYLSKIENGFVSYVSDEVYKRIQDVLDEK